MTVDVVRGGIADEQGLDTGLLEQGGRVLVVAGQHRPPPAFRLGLDEVEGANSPRWRCGCRRRTAVWGGLFRRGGTGRGIAAGRCTAGGSHVAVRVGAGSGGELVRLCRFGHENPSDMRCRRCRRGRGETDAPVRSLGVSHGGAHRNAHRLGLRARPQPIASRGRRAIDRFTVAAATPSTCRSLENPLAPSVAPARRELYIAHPRD